MNGDELTSAQIDDPDAQLARNYLLGRLSTEDAERFETRMLADEPTFEIVQAVKSELFDEYVRGTLGAEDRRTLAPRFEGEQSRLFLAEALAQKRRFASARRGADWRWAAAAAILVAIAGAALWQRFTPATPAIPNTPPVVATDTRRPDTPRPVVPEKIAAFTLAIATTRDGVAPVRLALDADVTSVALTIRLHPEDRYPTYLVSISRADGTSVWGGSTTLLAPGQIVVQVPSSRLPAGEYQIVVNGLDQDGAHEDLGDQTLLVRRSP